ncbi:MAG TPA: hypothetical protein VGO11_22165 [Chthoniobacteraceae bacterium]|nr:hypothetical protein [Chthoniobacteraceae bacterium]
MVANLPITIDEGEIAAFCRERGIRRLSLFGSVARADSLRTATSTCSSNTCPAGTQA